jgi:hypothetical protein
MCMYDTFAQMVWLLAASSGMLMLALRKKNVTICSSHLHEYVSDFQGT